METIKNIWFNQSWLRKITSKSKMTTIAILMSISSIINPAYSKDKDINNMNIQVKKSISEIIQTNKNAFLFISSILWENKWKITVTKEKLDTWYNWYSKSKSKLWPNIEESIRKFLFKTYTKLLRNWYKVHWYKELENIWNILKSLNKKEIDIKWWKNMPENPDFTEKVYIKLSIDWDKYIFNKNRRNERAIILKQLDILDLLDQLYSDTPTSIEIAKWNIAKLNYIKLKLQKTLIEKNREISKLTSQFESKIWVYKNKISKYEQSILDAEIAAKKAKALADKVLVNKLKELKEVHKKETSLLNKKIGDKDKNYKDLKSKYEQSILDAEIAAKKAKALADKVLVNKLKELKEVHKKEISEDKKEINSLEAELERQQALFLSEQEIHKKEIESLNDIIKGLNFDIAWLDKIIIQLNAIINTKKEENESKLKLLKKRNKEIGWLIQDNKKLSNDYVNSSKASSKLLEQAKNNALQDKTIIKELELEKKGLLEQIEKLENKILDLTEKAKKLKILEKQKLDFQNKLREKQKLDLKLLDLQKRYDKELWNNTKLLKEVQELRRLNKIEETKEELLEKIKQLNTKLNKITEEKEFHIQENIKNKDIIEELKKEIEELKTLLESLRKQRDVNWSNIKDITSLSKYLEERINAKFEEEITRLKKRNKWNQEEIRNLKVQIENLMKLNKSKLNEALKKQREQLLFD